VDAAVGGCAEAGPRNQLVAGADGSGQGLAAKGDHRVAAVDDRGGRKPSGFARLHPAVEDRAPGKAPGFDLFGPTARRRGAIVG
jgi:hypothetical protein